jgi:hypothetical protein
MMKVGRIVLMSILAAAVGSVSQGTLLAQNPNPNEVYVQSISYGGTGCPQGSVGNSFSNDRKSATLIFDSFIASTGPGVDATEARKNCQLNVNLHIPAGHTVSVSTYDYRGYVQLPAGQKAAQSSTYALTHPEGRDQAKFKGPFSADYLVRDKVAINTKVKNDSCQRVIVPLTVNAEVAVDKGQSSEQGQITTDSIDLKVETSETKPQKGC